MLSATTLARGTGQLQPAGPSPGPRECVILLHGLGRTADSMQSMQAGLAAAGFLTVNIDYPARKRAVEDLAAEYVPQGLQQCGKADAFPIHFVTHSLGGLLVRSYLDQHEVTALGRVVMLSPPNQGSEAADRLKDQYLYRNINGPAGQQIGTGPEDLPATLGPVDYPVGIITGNAVAFFDSWLAGSFPGEHDGKVSVERAKVDGMTDFLVLPYSHPFIMNAEEVISQTIHFLQHGVFARSPAD